MTVKKFKLFLASDVEKEEQWLTELSSKGLHLIKYRLGLYYFEEDPNHSYVYQIDFRDADDDYFQLYKDTGWEHIESFIQKFHYFRTPANKESLKKLYSDRESVKETFQRMVQFYMVIFFAMIVSQLGLILTWKGYVIQIVVASLVAFIFIIYLYLFFALKRKIDFYK
ncbi:DUF2812 domain-containing protein [Bacillus sp. FJAT-49732]|uniref:DUF2812 domain-containing protein n=1 Tax=Lederbergia citrisecunda TaxID=2833583 RepID=A0A942TS29_9BACI|nr:DUF2812 domain-containing protein [Lederbergia citrisecunda]MBS4201841.1 DUF2812 domain-containing protein [Lederbergia citrisecunda]